MSTIIGRFTSSATLESSWVNTNFPTTPSDMAVRGVDATTGSSNAIYIAILQITVDPIGGDTYSSYLMESQLTTGGGGTSTCVITHAVPGDIYNIGGVSNEPTTHIEFTLWDNSSYGKGKSKGK